LTVNSNGRYRAASARKKSLKLCRFPPKIVSKVFPSPFANISDYKIKSRAAPQPVKKSPEKKLLLQEKHTLYVTYMVLT
jgi:hypothetical protein